MSYHYAADENTLESRPFPPYAECCLCHKKLESAEVEICFDCEENLESENDN